MMQLWRWYRRNDRTFTLILGFIAIAMLLGSLFLVYLGKQDPNSTPVLDYVGYQPIYVQTGSMEPTMQTKSIVLTKRVDTLDDLEIDDIITYRVYDESGRAITITHRIYNIKEDGTIITKGDNNRVADSYSITIDNVLAEVIWIWNGAATIQNMMKTPTGWIMAIVAIAIIGLIWYAMHCLHEYLDEKYGVSDNVENSVNDRLLAEYEDDDEYEDDEDEEEGEKRPRSRTTEAKPKPQLLDEDRNSWQRIYNYNVSDDNLITITSLKPQFASLTELTIPREIKQKKVIGLGQFALRNSVATIINLPETLEFIEKAAFYHCEQLIYVEIPDTVKRIGANAFDGCKSLIDIKLPVHLTKIEDKLMAGCLSLDSITINDNVTSIGDSAFFGCNNLKTIYGGKNVNTIKLNAFRATAPINTNIITDNEYLANYNWMLFGRKPTVIKDAELLEALRQDNERLMEEYNKHQEDMKNKEEQEATAKLEKTIFKVKDMVAEKINSFKQAEKAKKEASGEQTETSENAEQMEEKADPIFVTPAEKPYEEPEVVKEKTLEEESADNINSVLSDYFASDYFAQPIKEDGEPEENQN